MSHVETPLIAKRITQNYKNGWERIYNKRTRPHFPQPTNEKERLARKAIALYKRRNYKKFRANKATFNEVESYETLLAMPLNKLADYYEMLKTRKGYKKKG